MCLGTRHLKFLDATIGHVQHILEFLSVCGGGGRVGSRGKDERISFKGMPSRASLLKKKFRGGGGAKGPSAPPSAREVTVVTIL